MDKKHTNHHLLKIKDIKIMSYNMMMMHEKSKMRQIPRRCRPVVGHPSGRTRQIVIIIIFHNKRRS
ncbi:hypothetical protein DB992_15445 [Salmonella enterica]|nr:hypothetical protein [Salmonella enterica]EBN4822276.1 hypothetical protein [Salmonella enterica]